jgi:trimeric autotransporter adhesin
MTSRIITKKGSGAPLSSDLVHGELAVDTVNKRLYTEDAGGSIIELGTSPSTIDINGGTIDGTVIGGTTPAAGTFTNGQFNTSLNVDGTVTADGLTVTGTLANWSIDSQGVVQTFTRPSTSYIRASDAAGNIAIQAGGSINRALFASNGDLSLYEDTGTTATFFWDASEESLGIGTSSPSKKLSLQIANEDGINIASSDVNKIFSISYDTANNIIKMGSVFSTGYGITPLTFWTNQNERMRIDASTGNVGIGTSTPSAKLEIGGAGEGIILASPDGTRYEITVANGGTLTVTAV